MRKAGNLNAPVARALRASYDMTASISLVTQSPLQVFRSWYLCGVRSADPFLLAVCGAFLCQFLGGILAHIGLGSYVDALSFPASSPRWLRIASVTLAIYGVKWYTAKTLDIETGKTVVRPMAGAYFYPEIAVEGNLCATQLHPRGPIAVYVEGEGVKQQVVQTTEEMVCIACTRDGTALQAADGSPRTRQLYVRCIVRLAGLQPRRATHREYMAFLTTLYCSRIVHDYFHVPDASTEVLDVKFYKVRTWFSPFLASLWGGLVYFVYHIAACFGNPRFNGEQPVHVYFTPLVWGFIDINEQLSLV